MQRILAAVGILAVLAAVPAYGQTRTTEGSRRLQATLSSSTCPGTGCAILDVPDMGTIGIGITGTWVGTIEFKGSVDGGFYQDLTCTPTNGTSGVSTTTANGLWTCSVAGVAYVQILFQSFTSGSAVITAQASPTGGGGSGGGGGAASSVTINDPSVTSQKANVNASGQLSVNCANCSGSGVSQQDNTGFTPGTTNMVPIGAEVDDAGTTPATENNAGVLRMSANRILYVDFTKSGGLPVGSNAIGSITNLFALDATVTGRLPAGASPANGESNTNTNLSRIGSFNFIFNGTTWDRWTGAVTGSGNFTVVQPTGTNLHAVLDSGTTTVTQGTGTNLHTVVDSGSITVTQATGTNLHAVIDSGSTTAVTQATASNLNAQVQGAGASGAAKAGNPVQIGGVFNTTQPTVTTGQTVEAQATARGELLIAKGVSGFSIDNTGFNATQSGTWTVQPGNTQNTTPWLTKQQRAATPTQTSVASSATNVTILASNSNRLGATIFNDSTQILYLKLGATASTTSFTVQLQPNAYYEVPFNYVGQIDGLWASANGNARVTELAQ